MLAERGLDISYETARRWFLKFGSTIAASLRRAVDTEGEVLDFLVQRKRDAKAAKKLMKKLLKKQGFAPTRIVKTPSALETVAFRTGTG